MELILSSTLGLTLGLILMHFIGHNMEVNKLKRQINQLIESNQLNRLNQRIPLDLDTTVDRLIYDSENALERINRLEERE